MVLSTTQAQAPIWFLRLATHNTEICFCTEIVPAHLLFSPPADYLQVSSFAWITPEGSWQKFLGDANCISHSNCSIYLDNKQTNNKQIKIIHTYIYTQWEWTFLRSHLQNGSDEETLILNTLTKSHEPEHCYRAPISSDLGAIPEAALNTFTDFVHKRFMFTLSSGSISSG